MFNQLKILIIAIAVMAAPVLVNAQAASTTVVANNSEQLQKAHKIERKINELDKKIASYNQQIASFHQKILNTEAELDQLITNEQQTKQQLAGDVNAFNSAMTKLIKMQRIPSEALMVKDTLKVQRQRQTLLKMGQQNLVKNIGSGREKVSEVERLTRRKEEALITLNQNKQQLEEKQKSVSESRAAQLKLLQLTSRERANLVKQADQLNHEKSLTAMLNKLGKSKYSQRILTAPRRFNHLPVQGKVVRDFNPHSEDGGLPSYGLTIASSAATPIKALSEGWLLFSGPFDHFGHLMIIDHGDSSHSVYGGMDKPKFKVGDFIQEGFTIGFTESNARPEVYLEIRQNNEAIDPKRWLRN